MTLVRSAPRSESATATTVARPSAPSASVPFHYTQTESFAALLHQLRASLLVTTYQANKLLIARAAGAGLSTLVRTFERPMGMAVDAHQVTLGTRDQIWTLRNAPDIAPQLEPAGQHDACFLPRSCHVTGDIGIHEIAWGKPLMPPNAESERELWVVNTRFSCLCTLHSDYSFVPRWQPPFITALAAEDRCHLNGLAIANGRPRYATALGETDTANGWRESKASGGCVIDIPGDAVVAHGLSMPHSPRWHDGKLWLLESGTGRLLHVTVATGQLATVAELPGFARGLALLGPYAFIGLSRIRESSALNGVPLAARREQLKCGVAVVDLRVGRIVAMLEFQSAVEEIFDVQLLPGLRFPEVIGFQQAAIQHTFIVPSTEQRVAIR